MVILEGEPPMELVRGAQKKSAKSEREHRVLISLVEHFIKTAKPVGSNTLKDEEFADLSSATIRNYFARLEEEGYLLQQHTSGGRIPTNKSFRLYATEWFEKREKEKLPNTDEFKDVRISETKEVTALLQKAAEHLAHTTDLAVFLSAPRFEQDFIRKIYFLPLDAERSLVALATDFGEIVTETLFIDKKISSFTARRIEAYCNSRITGNGKPLNMNPEEEELALMLYNEVMVRYIVRYTQFQEDDIYRTGFSKLLAYPEFQDPAQLASGLALFEHTQGMRLMLTDCSKHNTMKFWIGEELDTYAPVTNKNSSVIAIPYYVNQQPVGAIGLLGPNRIPYNRLFEQLSSFSHALSESLTHNLYKNKIAMRANVSGTLKGETEELKLLSKKPQLLLESKDR